MTRKKISDEILDSQAAQDLNDDEEIVVTNTSTVRKNKINRSEAEPVKANDAKEIDPADYTSFIDVEDEDDEPDPFPTGTIGHIVFGDDGDETTIRECNILVIRKPDGAGDKFLVPNTSRLSHSPIRNVDLRSTESEIEEQVRNLFGGGHYYLQTQIGNRNGKGWNTSLADLPESIAKAKRAEQATNQPAQAAQNPTASEPPKDPLDSMIDNITKMKLLRDSLFGDERAEMQKQIDDLKRELQTKPEPLPSAQLPENLQILEKALATTNPTLQEKLLDYAFPAETSGHWISETLKTILEHKEEIGGLLGSLLGGMTANRPPTPQAQSVEALLRNPAPTTLPTQQIPTPAVSPSRFQRRGTAPLASDTENADERSTDGKTEEISEVETDVNGN